MVVVAVIGWSSCVMVNRVYERYCLTLPRGSVIVNRQFDGYRMDALWIDFVNSDWHDHLGREPDRDQLADPVWLRGFIEEKGLPRIDSRNRAVRAGLGMFEALDDLNPYLKTMYGQEFDIRVGVHIGEVVVGTIGIAPMEKLAAR